MAKNRLLSFGMTPAAWGLKGDAYEIAEAHYYYDGEELDRKLAMINYRSDPKALQRQNIELDFRHNRIDTYAYDHKIAKLEIEDPKLLELRQIEIETMHAKITPYDAAKKKVEATLPSGTERDVALLEVEHQFNHLSKTEFEKRRATLRNEPWVAIVNSGFDPEQGIDGVFFEFDWNTQWIDFLKLNGYVGHTAEQILDDWFTEVCRSHSTAELAGSLAPSRNLHHN